MIINIVLNDVPDVFLYSVNIHAKKELGEVVLQ